MVSFAEGGQDLADQWRAETVGELAVVLFTARRLTGWSCRVDARTKLSAFACFTTWDKLFVGMGTPLVYLHRTSREVSSVVEHLLHTQGVAGSKPAPRTIPPRSRASA